MESKPSPLGKGDKKKLEAELKEVVKKNVDEQERLNAVRKRTGAFQADLVALETKHKLRIVAVLNQNHNGIYPGMIVVDPEEHPEYSAPHIGKVPADKKKKILKKKD